MAAPALRNTIYSEAGAYEDDDLDTRDFYPGERIGPPPRRRSKLARLMTWTFVLAAGYAALPYFREPPPWLQQIAADVASLATALTANNVEPAQPDATALAATAPAEPPPLQTAEVAEAPSVEAGTPVPSPADAVTASAETAAVEEAPPAPAPKIELTDPYQKKAEAVGLSPDVSKVLLKKMSADDYRNAGIAIKTALAETPDDGIFTYPSERKAGLAHFQIHFVQGALESCRRYVVTVTKDRWQTTAPAMEKCGIGSPKQAANKMPAG